MSKVVVTGVAGFIGGHLAQRLLDLGYDVIGIDDYSTGHYSNVPKGVHFWNLDISKKDNANILDSVCDGADIIFHLAAKARVQPSIANPVLYHETNVNGLLAMLEIARKYNSKFIFSSSSSVVGDTELYPTPEHAPCNPISPYALHKLIGEQYCKMYAEVYGLRTVSLRYFNVYGERMPTEGAYRLVLGIWANQMKNGKPLTITGSGYNRRDFTYVGDVVEANILAATKDVRPGEVFNIGNGDNRSIREVAELFNHPIEFIEERLEPMITLANNNKAKQQLGWKPTMNIEEWLPTWIKTI
jgi:UDP-glucose 4-epimerase